MLAASGDGGFLSSAIAGSARSARLGQIRPFKEGIVTAAASVVGPMFTAYTLWVLLDVLNRGGRVIYFLARDGQVLAKICQRLARWLNIDVDICYIYASRQAFLLPALHNEGDNIINEALKLSYYDQIDLEEALTSLNYSSEELVYIAKLLPYNLRRISSSLSHNEMSALKAALSRKDLLKSLRARVHEAYFATLAYLDSKGMLSSSEACIVDLGWRGSTQLRLQKILGNNVKLRGYYMGISNSVLSAEDCICRWTTKVSLKTGLLEVMASSDHTTVKGFTFSLDGQPDCSPPIVEDKTLVQWGSRQQQEVALRFCDYLLEAVEVDTFTAQEFYQALKDAGLDAYHHFRLSPTWVEAEAYGSMPHQIDVNHAKFQELAPSVHNVDILRKILCRKSQGFNTSWYMGSIARSSNKSNLAKSIHLPAGRYIEFKARFITRKRRKDLDKFARHLLKS
ncbi:hypothetical protein FV228_23025 [Methylobacterium sp. WL18]|nr:hypothetical protein FV228_23025 [Methylobacterium sp. WL18]